MSIIRDILNRDNNAKMVDKNTTSFDLNKTYKLYDIKICQLARISNKKQKTLSARDIISRIVKYDALMIRVKPNWYMDIESGRCYELGGIFGEDLQCPNNKYYISGTEPFIYTCNETIQSKEIDGSAECSAVEIRQLYNSHFANSIKNI